MTAAAVPATRQARDRRDARSFAAVVVLAVVALTAGMLIRLNVERAVQPVSQAGLNAELPDGWIVLPAAGDRLLTAYDPLDPDLRYGVAAVDPVAGATLTPEDAAAQRLRDRGRLVDGFAISTEGPGTLGAVPTYEVRYSFVDQAIGGQATHIETIEHYLPDGAIFPGEDRILAIILEAPTDKLDDALPEFERFAGELAGRAGTVAALPRVVAVRDGGPRLASIVDSPAAAQAAPAAIGDLVNATVQILMVATIGGQEQAYGWGSGTIVTADGLILTNAHVAVPTAAGLGVFDADPTPAVDPEDLVVAIIATEDQPAVPMYRASVVAADGYLDAALIQIDRDLNGQPLANGALNLPTVPIGDSDALHVGDPLTIVGFPGIGGNTISLSNGSVSGFLGDDRIGPRAWIKTDAVVSSGNSGGLAANAAGEVIGIPTRAQTADVGGYSWVRPIALVMPLIQGAQAGLPPVDSPYLVAETGTESLQLDAWTNTGLDCPAQTRLTSYPSGTLEIIASLEHAGFVSGEDLVGQWRLDGEIVYRSGFRLGEGAEVGGCVYSGLYYDRGLPDGTYLLELFAGPRLRALTTAQTTIGSVGATGATLSGVVLDGDSGQPVPGAVIFLLAPGTDIAAWVDNPQEGQIASFAKSAADGTFVVYGLAAGNSYPALAMAEGYVAAGGNIGPMLEGDNSLLKPIALTRVAP